MRLGRVCAVGVVVATAACGEDRAGRRGGPSIDEPPIDNPGDPPGDPPDDPPAFACPAPGALPDAQPYQDYALDGAAFLGPGAEDWAWTVDGGPCDQLFAAEGKPTSFALGGVDRAKLTFRPTVSGDYAITVAAQVDGAPASCSFAVHVRGSGLRVELCWDDSGQSALDLHLHAPHTTTPWFPINLSNACSFANCSAFAEPHVDWGYAPSALEECVHGPDGEDWRARGGCSNPRLDFDNVAEAGRAENINLDLPEDGATYRAMAAYSTGIGARSPIANVYCAGRLVASYGRAPDRVPGFDTPGDGSGSTWRVADITTHVDAYGATTCDVAALHPAGQTTGYDVRVGNPRY